MKRKCYPPVFVNGRFLRNRCVVRDIRTTLESCWVRYRQGRLRTTGPLDLAATITMSPTLMSGETYRITARFFDRRDVKREVLAEVVVQLED